MERDLLRRQLADYAAKDRLPLHMPGHKRRLAPAPGLPFALDVTELPDTDDLHDAGGILAAAMNRTAALYGAARTWYLVNGSTGGLLAAVRALAPAGSAVIAARNCHKSVFHAIELGGLSVRWLLPPQAASFGVWGSVPPQSVAQALDACPQARCVILTSPTYEGAVSDIAAIAALCHRRGVPLLVDEAHGAHLGLPWAAGFPAGALQSGADLVVQSAHKTLPSLTQTAWLHLGGPLAQRPGIADEIERQLDVFETSSPSYPLLVSLDGCTGLLRADGAALFAGWKTRLDCFYAAAAQLKRLRVLGTGNQHPPEFFAFDRGKLLVSGRGTGFSGPALAAQLRGRFGIETEMACGENLLAMTGPGDAEDALDRFAAALAALDAEAGSGTAPAPLPLPAPGETVCTIAAALAAPAADFAPAEVAGRVAAEYLWAYPPGVPLAAPGERLTPQLLASLAALEQSGTRIHHSHAKNGCLRALLG